MADEPPNPVGNEVKDKPAATPWKPGTFAPVFCASLFLIALFVCARSLNLSPPHWELVQSNLVHSASVSAARPSPVTERHPKLPEIDRVTRELVVRFFWGITAVLFTFLCVSIVFVSCRISAKVFWQNRKMLIGWAVVFIGLLILGCNRMTEARAAFSGGAAAEELLSFIKTPTPAAASGSHPPSKVTAVESVISVLTGSAGAALLMAALAACALINEMRKLDSKAPGAADQFESLASQGVNLLQLTAVGLIAGVLEIYFLFVMASYHGAELLLQNVQYFASGAATAAGLIYTSLLATIFLPLVVEQRAACRRILASQEPTLAAQKQKRLREFAKNDMVALPAIKAGLVFLSPLIASFLTKQLATLTGGL